MESNFNWPKISVVTPSYNQADFIEETLLSVLNQGYPNLEYIVIDGGSTDGSVSIIEKYASRLNYWVSEKDQGMYHAIQKGFERSTGEVMCWVNSDDLLVNKSLFAMGEIFARFPQVNWLSGSPTYLDERGVTINLYSAPSWSRLSFLMGDFRYINQPNTVWRRSLWEKAGSTLDIKSQLAGDFELWFRFFRYDKLYRTPAALGSHRSRSKDQKSLEHIGAYDDECLAHIKNEPKTISEISRIRRAKWLRFLSFYLNFPIIKRELNKTMDYAPAVYYQVADQKFIMGSE